MITVKRRYDDKELLVFDNVDEAMKYFGRRRKTIYKGINALLLVFGLVLGIFQILFHPSLTSVLMSVILLAIGGFYCITTEPNIRAPERFRVVYSEEDGKWLLFPVDKYPAVAFVRENEYDTMEKDYTIDAFERDLKKNAVANRIFAGGIFLSAILLPIIGPSLCVATAVGAFVVGMVILYW